MSQDPSISLPLDSHPSKGENPAPVPTPKWKIWDRGINKAGDFLCTHRFEDGTETYHYVNKNRTIYLKHRDGSATYIPVEDTYAPRGERDPDSKVPALTMEEIIEEANEVKKEHREYLASPIRYWNGARTTFRRGYTDLSWLFPTCDCGDRHYSTYDDDYPSYDSDDPCGYEYPYDYEDCEPTHADLVAYGLADEEEEEDSADDDQSSMDLDVDDEEEDETEDDQSSPSLDVEDGEEDRSSLSLDEHKPSIKEEDDKTTARIVGGAHLLPAGEAQVDVKHEIKEETHNGPILTHPTILKLEPEVIPGSSFVPDLPPPESAATKGSAGEQASHKSEVGPDVETEGKRILRSHRSKPY